jgi:hypothetical protein
MAKLHHRLKHLAQARQIPRHDDLMCEWCIERGLAETEAGAE